MIQCHVVFSGLAQKTSTKISANWEMNFTAMPRKSGIKFLENKRILNYPFILDNKSFQILFLRFYSAEGKHVIREK